MAVGGRGLGASTEVSTRRSSSSCYARGILLLSTATEQWLLAVVSSRTMEWLRLSSKATELVSSASTWDVFCWARLPRRGEQVASSS